MNPQAAQARGFRHEAFFYSSDEEFLLGTVPYLEEGIGAGETVLVVLPEERMQLVKEALGSNAEAVEFWSMGNVGRNPARLIPAWRDFLYTCDLDRGVRGLGEPISPDRSAAELEECELHERLFNLAFAAERSLTVMCPYDTRGLDHEVLEGAERSHPVCAHPHGKAVSPRYSLDAPLEGTLAQPARPAVRLDFGRADLAMVRHLVAQCARSAGLDSRRNEDLVLAVCEVATNSVQHGGGTGRLHVWDEDGELVCAVRDAGHIDDPLVGRQRPRPDQDHGRGLWIANQLCDLVQVRSGEAGTDVRLRMHFDG
ncbi:MAG TPA: sensor histidine kinase [Solirubrobacterales bacterium]|nr:sensor histidine kinase [Solirubrobacterales bacterium]